MPATDQEQKDLYKPGGDHDKLDDMSPSEKAESDQLLAAAADRKSYFRGAGKPKRGGSFFQRRKKSLVTGALLGTLGLGGLGGFFVLQGPFQLIHFAQLLQQFHFTNNEDAQDSRMGKIVRYIRYPHNPEMRRLGPMQTRNAVKIEAELGKKGYKLNYSDGFSGRVVSIDLPDNADIKKLEAYGHTIDVDEATGKRKIVLEGDDFGLRRGAIKSVVGDALGMGKIGSAISSRNLIKKAGVKFSVYNKVLKKADELEAAWRKRRSKNVKAEVETGNSSVDAPRAGPDDPNAPDTPDADADTSTKVDTSKSTVRKVLTGAAGVEVLCTIKALGSQAEELEHTTVTLRLIRMGTRIIAAGNQIMSGDIKQIQEIGLDSQKLYDKGTPGLAKDADDYRPSNSWANAKSIQAESGQEQTGPDIPDNARPDGGKNVASAATSWLPAPVCTVSNFLGYLDIVGTLAGLGISATGVLDSVFEGLARLLAGDPVAFNASGAILGNYANYGARHAASQQAIGMGGRQLSDQEVAQLDAGAREERIKYASSRGFKYKYFDINNPNSVTAQTLASLHTPRVNDLIPKPSSFATILTGLPKKLFARTHALSTYNYGFSEYGFSQAELNNSDESLANPFANETALFAGAGNDELFSKRLNQLNEDYGKKCFGVTLKMDGGFAQDQAKPYDEIPSDCVDTSNPKSDLNRYRMYVLDSMTMASLDCYNGEESMCDDFGIGEQTSASGGANAVSGDCATLGPKVMDLVEQGKINPDHDGSFATDVTECRVQPGILGFMVQLAEQGNFNYAVGALKSDHKQCTNKGSTSQHFYGLAVDIGSVSKSPLPDINKWVFENRETLNVYDMFYDPGVNIDNGKPNTPAIGGHGDHVHVGIKGEPIAPTNDSSGNNCG